MTSAHRSIIFLFWWYRYITVKRQRGIVCGSIPDGYESRAISNDSKDEHENRHNQQVYSASPVKVIDKHNDDGESALYNELPLWLAPKIGFDCVSIVRLLCAEEKNLSYPVHHPKANNRLFADCNFPVSHSHIAQCTQRNVWNIAICNIQYESRPHNNCTGQNSSPRCYSIDSRLHRTTQNVRASWWWLERVSSPTKYSIWPRQRKIELAKSEIL